MRALLAVVVLASGPAAADWYAYIDENGTPVVTDQRRDPRAVPYRIGDFERKALGQKGVPHAGLGLENAPFGGGAPTTTLRDFAGNAAYDDLIREASAKFGVPFGLVKAVIAVESGFRPEVASRAGAVGLMQLMPGTAKDLGVVDRTDPRQNVLGGTRYLAFLLKHFKDEELAIAAYNAGPGRVMRAGGVPPIAETRAYVRNVLAMQRQYRE
jgi:soluble lytic murein transglycosylase-like protein